MPTVSVVIASKVGAPFLDQCLESVRAEAKALAAEVIVVAVEPGDVASRFP